MTKPGLVSVVMPNHNHAHYLPRALDAMLAQTWGDLEIIVVDDASSDNSIEVVKGYIARDGRVRLFALEKNGGVNRAVTEGLAMATGEYLHAAAADDFVEPVFLERCVAELTRNPKAGLCFSDPTEYYEQDDRKVSYPLYLSSAPVYYAPQSLVALLKRNYFHISSNTCVFRTDAFRDAGGFMPDLHWLSDWFLVHVLACRHGACYLPGGYTYLSVRSDSYSARNLRESREQRPLFELALRQLASPRYADVAGAFRQAGLLPEYNLRTMYWLFASLEGRRRVTPHLCVRIVTRGLWSYLRPMAPTRLRRWLRHALSSFRGA